MAITMKNFTNIFNVIQFFSLKQFNYFIFKRKHVAVKIRIQLFLAYLSLVLLAVFLAFSSLFLIKFLIDNIAVLDIAWIKSLNLTDKTFKYAGFLTMLLGLIGKLYFLFDNK